MRYFLVLLFGLTLIACSEDAAKVHSTEPPPRDLIFAAVEDDGALAVIDGETGSMVRTVDLSVTAHGARVKVAVHNVQADPNGSTVWLTAMPSAEGGAHTGGAMMEELIGVDINTYSVVSRIQLGAELHVAHVVIYRTIAYVTANQADAVLVVDLAQSRVVRSIRLPNGTGPHGLRITPDGRLLAVAGMGDGSLLLIDTARDSVTRYALPGRAVQTAILPDGSAALATIYDTRQVAHLNLLSQAMVLFNLPTTSAGPVQLYPSPDSRSVWVADQGMLGNDPAGRSLIEIDARTGELRHTVSVDPAPHGVVMNAEGTKAWTTTLVNGSVQAIDTVAGVVLSTTAVGNKPNGISCRHVEGVMP